MSLKMEPPKGKEGLSKASRRSPFFLVLHASTLVSNLCSKSPLSFTKVVLGCFGGSYFYCAIHKDVSRPIAIGVGLLFLYYFLIASFRILVYNRYLDPLLEIPGPKGHWLLGNLKDIRDSPAGVPQRKWAEEYANPLGCISFPFLAARRIIPYSPAALSFFLNSSNYIKPPRTSHFIKQMIGGGLLTSEYDVHKRQRRILTPAFAVGHLRSITPHFWAKANQLVKIWEPLVDNLPEEGIDVTKWMSRVTLDIIGLAGFGFDFDSITSEDQPVAATYQVLIQPSPMVRVIILLNYMFPPLKYLPIGPNVQLQNARKTIRDTALSMIRLKQEQGTDKEGRGERDILGVMIEENRKSRENGKDMDALSEDEMVDQIMTFLTAGHETTSVAVTWALYLLSIHPEVQERLRKEVQTLDLDDSPSFEQVESLRYLNNVCREVVRFIPPVEMTIRQADNVDVYKGIMIPAGTMLFFMPSFTNFDARVWGENPDEFNPDRWDHLPEENSNYSFMTFLQGTRSCIGRRFAETEMKCLLAVLVGKYRYEETVPGRKVERETTLTVRPKGGMPLRILRV